MPGAPPKRPGSSQRRRAKRKLLASGKLPKVQVAPASEPRRRRPLTHVGGPTSLFGDPALGKLLAQALDVDPDESRVMATMHGFHSYPARLHPDTAARLIRSLSEGGATLLDPFCGSGTTLVEARALGRRGIGMDANPLALELSWLKTSRVPERARVAIRDAAAEVVEHAEDRRLAKAGTTRRYGEEDTELFDRHVLMELDSIRAGIERLAEGDVRRALFLVLSALLTKFSKRSGDSTSKPSGRRFAAGFPTRFFSQKVSELCRRLAEYESRLPLESREPKLLLGDARELRGVRSGSVDFSLSSPPYPGVYDYFAQHEMRLRWLGLDARSFAERELGARRRAQRLSADEAQLAYASELKQCLVALKRVLVPGGRAAWVIADGVTAGRALYTDDLVKSIADQAGLSLLAIASQERPHFHGPTAAAFRRRKRREHVVLLARQPGSG